MINASMSLRNVFNSLAWIVENSGSPDPLTLAKYEAKIVEMAPREATAAPIYTSHQVRILMCAGKGRAIGAYVST